MAPPVLRQEYILICMAVSTTVWDRGMARRDESGVCFPWEHAFFFGLR